MVYDATTCEYLDLQSLDLVLESPDLAHQVGRLVGGDAAGDDSAGDTAGTSEGHLGRDIDVRDVLVFACSCISQSPKYFMRWVTYTKAGDAEG